MSFDAAAWRANGLMGVGPRAVRCTRASHRAIRVAMNARRMWLLAVGTLGVLGVAGLWVDWHLIPVALLLIAAFVLYAFRVFERETREPSETE